MVINGDDLEYIKVQNFSYFCFPLQGKENIYFIFWLSIAFFFFFFPFFSRAIPRLQVSFSSSPLLAEEKRKDIESFGYEVS